MKPWFLMLIALLFASAMAACAAPADQAVSPALTTLQNFINALVAKDEAKLSSMVCADYEPAMLLELDAFQGVDTKLEGLDCAENGAQDGATLVKCQGKIIASYQNEQQTFDLSKRTYRLVEQGSDWLVCGYSNP